MWVKREAMFSMLFIFFCALGKKKRERKTERKIIRNKEGMIERKAVRKDNVKMAERNHG